MKYDDFENLSKIQKSPNQLMFDGCDFSLWSCSYDHQALNDKKYSKKQVVKAEGNKRS